MLADQGGIESVTMRRLADELGSEAMSLYYHVANKDDLLDGVVDVIAREINEAVARVDVPATGAAWKAALRRRILAARDVLLRHKWAPALFEARATASPAILHYYDALVGLMRAGGFSYDLIHHALHALGSRALGFSPEPFDPGDEGGAAGGGDASGPGTGASESGAGALPEEMASQFPHLAEMMMEVAHDDPDSTLGWCDDQTEFEFGLDLILNGLDGLR
jgi:AcrR family transcriptional regulator